MEPVPNGKSSCGMILWLETETVPGREGITTRQQPGSSWGRGASEWKERKIGRTPNFQKCQRTHQVEIHTVRKGAFTLGISLKVEVSRTSWEDSSMHPARHPSISFWTLKTDTSHQEQGCMSTQSQTSLPVPVLYQSGSNQARQTTQ